MDKREFTAEELAHLKESALKEYFQGKLKYEDYFLRIGPLIAQELTKYPEHYMLFGVYWWSIKAALNKIQLKGWWNNSDSDTAITIPEEPLNETFLTGMIYREYNIQQLSHEHARLGSDGEYYSYYLQDDGAPSQA